MNSRGKQNDQDYPPTKAYVRGTVLLSAYLIRSLGNGCHITYLSNSDPKGSHFTPTAIDTNCRQTADVAG